MGSAPIVAGTISLAVGAALAASIRGDKNIAVSFFGDGASGEGVLYESLNFASLKHLPIIFVCENNLYSTHLPINECRPNPFIFKVGVPFNVRRSRIDGNDVLKVYEAAREAANLCRNGSGPVLLECVTYRLRGHVGPDDNVQGSHIDTRPADEVEKWKRKDPIKRFKQFMLTHQAAKPFELDQIEQAALGEIKEAHQFAHQSDHPNSEEMANYVFAT